MGVDTIKASIGYGANPSGRPEKDSYETPRIAVDKLLGVEKFEGPILEPAAGTGAISKVLEEHGYSVISTDLYDYRYGRSGLDFTDKNFIADYLNYPFTNGWDFNSIVTNPPYSHAQEFIEQGLSLTKDVDGKLALLLRLSFLEGQKRKVLLETSPLKKVYVFSKRLTFHRPGDEGKDYSGMLAFAWFIFDWKYKGEPTLGWI